MFEPTKLSRALKGFSPFAPNTPGVIEATAPQADGSGVLFEQREGGTGPKLDEPALERLLSRAEVELSEPDAIQRRMTIAHLKVAAISSRR